jgi:Secretion system C-terminal sorting domain
MFLPYEKKVVAFFAIVCLFLLRPAVSFGQQSAQPAVPDESAVSPEIQTKVMQTLKKSSHSFQLIENRGQENLPKNIVAYFNTNQQAVFIEKNKIRVVVYDPNDAKKNQPKKFAKEKVVGIKNSRENLYHYNSFTINFKGSNGFSELIKGKPLETQRSYFSGRSPEKWITDIQSYSEITLKNIYPKIDIRIYNGENGQMEFDWIVWPGANTNDIKMKFDGQKHLMINNTGDIMIGLRLGNFKLRLPESYYSTPSGKEAADVKFTLHNKNEVRFKEDGKRNSSWPLVIDPELLWGTYFDGNLATFDEYLFGLDFSSANNLLYCTGRINVQINSTYVAAITGANDGTFSGGSTDVIIYALTKDGASVQYITYLGAGGVQEGYGISTSANRVFVCGFTNSATFPVTNGSGFTIAAFDNTKGTGNDGFVAVLSNKLDKLYYSSYMGGNGADICRTIRARDDNTYYVSLSVGTTALPVAAPNYIVNAADATLANTEGWIGKFTGLNTLQFGTYVGGASTDDINDFQVLSNNDVVFTGNTGGITEVNGTVANGAGSDVLFGRLKVPASGATSFVVLDQFGAAGTDMGYGIINLGDSVSIIVGQASIGFPLGTGPYFDNTFGGGTYDAFIARIKNDGTGGYKADFVGGNGFENLMAVRFIGIGGKGAVFCFGTTQSTDLPVQNFNTESFYSATKQTGYDMMFLICNITLDTKHFLSYAGGDADDYLGESGTPIGSNQLYFLTSDSTLFLGTTHHSTKASLQPVLIGRGAADINNFGIPAFDETREGSTVRDVYIIMAISVGKLAKELLPLKWESFSAKRTASCSVQLVWKTSVEDGVEQFHIERSVNGNDFEKIATIASNTNSNSNNYFFEDRDTLPGGKKLYYRIQSEDIDGRKSYSAVRSAGVCRQPASNIFKIYPNPVVNYFIIENIYGETIPAQFSLYNMEGKLVENRILKLTNGETVHLTSKPAAGMYLITMNDPNTGELLFSQKINIRR